MLIRICSVLAGLWIGLTTLYTQTVYAEITLPAPQVSAVDTPPSLYEKLRKSLGVTYFSFFYGPGIHPDKFFFNPNQIGQPQNDGVYLQNQVSLRYKFHPKLAIDFQTRFNLILNNTTNNPNFNFLRWEAPRIGISGTLASGEDWTFVGAINTDFPYFMPAPFTGYQAQQRTVILNPGMFANFSYSPRDSRWSIFSVVNPRYFFYTNRNAAEAQMLVSGLLPQNKPELIISILPTVNYRMSPKASLTIGSNLDYRKQVISSWNFLNASLLSNGSSQAWRLNAIPANIGMTFSLSDSLVVFPFVTFYPIAIQRKDDRDGRQASFLEATSVGMWLRGSLF